MAETFRRPMDRRTGVCPAGSRPDRARRDFTQQRAHEASALAVEGWLLLRPGASPQDSQVSWRTG